MTDEIFMYWWGDASHKSNFGDAVSPRIVKALTGANIHRRETNSVPRLLACGSILKWGQPGDTIWGSGHGSIEHPTRKGIIPCAVRGPLSRASLQASGIHCPPVYGDPALLLPMLYGPKKSEKRYSVGVVPHYVDKRIAESVLTKDLARDDVRLIDILAPFDEVTDAIASCDLIVSSSLHGIVAADAYRVPSVWVEFSDGVSGRGMKFRDYHLSLRDDFLEPLNWRRKGTLSDAVGTASLSSSMRLCESQRDLLKAAPFRIVHEKIPDVALREGWIDTWDR